MEGQGLEAPRLEGGPLRQLNRLDSLTLRETESPTLLVRMRMSLY